MAQRGQRVGGFAALGDGYNQRARVRNAGAAALEQLGWLDDAQRKILRPWGEQLLWNARGNPVGEIRAAFKFTMA